VVTILIIIGLVVLSGLFSGLTLGLLGLDKSDLERKIKAGNKNAKKIYPIRKRGNLLLCTLLLGNVLVNSILAVFLGEMSTGIIAVVASTGLIVIFGEILPQATISRYALVVGAKTVWIVHIFRILLFPVCFPIAKFLDWILGEEMPTIWSRRELEEIIRTHEDSKHSDIDADEERIILGAMKFSDRLAEEVMTPKPVVFMLESEDKLDISLLNKIKKTGFTRIPVFKKHDDNLVGVLYVKDLINVRKNSKAGTICRKKNIIKFSTKDNLDILLNTFIKKKVHIGFVYDEFKVLHGIATLEDVVEEIIQREIVDEEDTVTDMRKQARKKK
jgi:metal transporter CNNM